jgi:hypothetical protein
LSPPFGELEDNMRRIVDPMTLAARLGRPRGERRARDHPARHDAAPGGDVADAAVAMLVVVPLDEPHRPLPRSVKLGEPLERELRPILRCAEQCFGEF